MSHYCNHCIHDNGDDKLCDIIACSMAFSVKDKDYPQEWTYDEEGNPTCTKYEFWNWRDDDGGRNEPPMPEPDNPNQLCLPFIFEEMEYEQEKKVATHA